MAVADLRGELADGVAAECTAAGGRGVAYHVDVANATR